MIIGITNISTFGLRLLEVKNQQNLPPRKHIMDNASNADDNLIYDEFDVVVKLFGKYASAAAAGSAVASLKSLLQSAVVHGFSIDSRNLYFSGIVKNGFEVIPYDKKLIINMNITVTECQAGNLTA